MNNRCDSFGNRPVTAPTNRNRQQAFGSGRIRTGSNSQQIVQKRHNSNSDLAPHSYNARSNSNRDIREYANSHFIVRKPITIVNPNVASSSNAATSITNKDSNNTNVQTNKGQENDKPSVSSITIKSSTK